MRRFPEGRKSVVGADGKETSNSFGRKGPKGKRSYEKDGREETLEENYNQKGMGKTLRGPIRRFKSGRRESRGGLEIIVLNGRDGRLWVSKAEMIGSVSGLL